MESIATEKLGEDDLEDSSEGRLGPPSHTIKQKGPWSLRELGEDDLEVSGDEHLNLAGSGSESRLGGRKDTRPAKAPWLGDGGAQRRSAVVRGMRCGRARERARGSRQPVLSKAQRLEKHNKKINAGGKQHSLQACQRKRVLRACQRKRPLAIAHARGSAR